MLLSSEGREGSGTNALVFDPQAPGRRESLNVTPSTGAVSLGGKVMGQVFSGITRFTAELGSPTFTTFNHRTHF